jgi:hypothetical protein
MRPGVIERPGNDDGGPVVAAHRVDGEADAGSGICGDCAR